MIIFWGLFWYEKVYLEYVVFIFMVIIIILLFVGCVLGIVMKEKKIKYVCLIVKLIWVFKFIYYIKCNVV